MAEICGAVSQTPFARSAQCRSVTRVVASRLSPEAFETAFSRGTALSVAELVALANSELGRFLEEKELGGTSKV